jgi:hypothetical protein
MKLHVLAFLSLPVFFASLVCAQETRGRSPQGKRDAPAQQASREMFSLVQEVLLSGDVGAIRASMSGQVYLSLRGGVNGYYSANQAYYLLDQFLKAYRITSLKFTTYGESESSPYATGSVYLTQKSSHERGQVYVSLSPSGGRWVISQISLY